MGLKVKASSTAANAPVLPDGASIYPARFEGVTEKEAVSGQYGTEDKFIWAFTLMDAAYEKPLYDQGEPLEVEGMTSQSTNTKSKTTPRPVRYLKAIMSPKEFAQFEAEEDIDTDDLIGRFVQVECGVKDNGWPTVLDVIKAPAGKAAK